MQEDGEGFLYPYVDQTSCMNCGLCEKVCPVINQADPRTPRRAYAAKNPNEEIRIASSSGGVFAAIAERTINNGGVVFGAQFNDKWEVVHSFAETMEGIVPFRGSKYTQSVIGECYRRAEDFLKHGRQVLFTATPCQIAGLRAFLQTEYENLITVDVVCHGVPSPLVWKKYLEAILKREGVHISDILSISFRSKRAGWRRFGLEIEIAKGLNSNSERPGQPKNVLLFEPRDKNAYLQGFLRDFYLRHSCYACSTRCGKSQSDITIADYWGVGNVHGDLDDNMGTSLVLVNTVKGESVFDSLSLESCETSFAYALKANPSIERSPPMSNKRSVFFSKIEDGDLALLIEALAKTSYTERIIRRLKSMLRFLNR